MRKILIIGLVIIVSLALTVGCNPFSEDEVSVTIEVGTYQSFGEEQSLDRFISDVSLADQRLGDNLPIDVVVETGEHRLAFRYSDRTGVINQGTHSFSVNIEEEGDTIKIDAPNYPSEPITVR